MNRYSICAIALVIAVAGGHAETFSSGPARTALIELYTSEGCSSCPPADRKMNKLAGRKGLWSDFVPVAFHVDYWNYLGWNDPFTSADYSVRQRRYTKEWNARSTYTPCFVVNGVATRNIAARRSPRETGILKVVTSDETATVTYAPADASNGELTAWLALLSGPVESSVTAGENRGRRLEHNFVALGLTHDRMTAANGEYAADLTIAEDDRTKAIAVWVSQGDSLKPLQATGGWLSQ